jgi:hypothetical protein
MDFIQRPTAIEVLTRDESKNEGRVRQWVPMSLAHTAIELYLPTLGQRVEVLSDAQITGATITYLYVSRSATSAAADSQIARMGVFILQDAAGYRHTLTVPALKASKLEASGPWAGIRIDQHDPDVAALVNLLVAGNGTLQPVTYQLGDIITLTTAFLQERW